MKYNPSDSNYLDFLASFESIISSSSLTEEEQFTIRSSTVQALKNRKKFSTLSSDETKALKALKQDEDIIILPADEGGATTILNKTDYTDIMMSLLKDDSTYEPLATDPTKSQNSHIEKTLKRLSGKKLITGVLAKSLKQDGPTIAKIYGPPKIHKTDIPLRPIVSLIGAPNYKISKWLFRQLHPLTKNSENSIQDSKEFLDKLNGVNITCDEIMVSFDVVSLFTSIPLDLAKKCTEELLQTYTSEVPPEALLQLLDLCLETNFSFSNQYYRQLKGAPMGSPISGFLVEAVLQKLESISLPTVNPKLWLRYVDDTFVIVKKDQLNLLHTNINSIFPGTTFTFETEVDGQLPFLDVLSTTILAAYEDIQEDQLVVLFLLHRKLNVREDGVEMFFECQHLIPFDDDEGIIHIPGPELRFVVLEDPAHSTGSGHTFKFDEAEILARGDNRVSRELLESWFTGPQSINKCNDLPIQYSVMRLRLGGVIGHAGSAQVNTRPNTRGQRVRWSSNHHTGIQCT
ncbi:hypothetical protein SprV_0902770700 [Sparganum proliferum]